VLWTQSIRTLAAQGVAKYIEVGPGGVLTGLLKNIDPSLKGQKFGEASDLEKLNEVVS
jgi:malonyl CoA-acyl carrier protein transacylase